MSDIGNYHSKKLELLRLKLGHVREMAPPVGHRKWVTRLKAMYREEPNKDELWVDMFLRFVSRYLHTSDYGVETGYVAGSFAFKCLGVYFPVK